MNLWEALTEGKRLLAEASDEPGVEAELLLRHVLHFDRGQLYRRLTEPLTPQAELPYRELLRRRTANEPTPYILGHKEFFGLDFLVTPAALIPRPETETLVELALAFARDRIGEGVAVADIGTGCGAIAVSLAHALPQAEIVAIDSSNDALALAEHNAKRHGLHARIRFLHGDLLDPLDSKVDVLVANLPYIPTDEWERLPPEIREHEPHAGLDGGPDGLRVIERFFQEAPDHLQPRGAAFVEIGDQQAISAALIASRAFPQATIAVRPDLAGRPRVLDIRT